MNRVGNIADRPYHGFRRHLDWQAKRSEITVFVWESDEFSKIEFYAIMNRNVKILSGRLYSPSLKNVGWTENAQLIFLIFHTVTCIFFPAPPLLPFQIYGKLEKLIERVIPKLAWSFKLGEQNLLLTILTLRFINCVKFNFGKKYLPSDSHTNTVISDRFA